MTEMNMLKIKRKSYFVIEAINIINKQGINKLSARTVSQKAGFNTSSIYTYFTNMDHLESLACIAFTKEYLLNLDKSFRSKSWIEKYIIMWEQFLKYSFRSPIEFSRVFYPSSREEWTYNLYKEYFDMFPDENIFDESILQYFTIGSTERGYHRDKYLLKNAVKEGSLDMNKIDYIAEVNIAYTYYIVCDIVNGVLDGADPKLYNKCMSYILLTLKPYVAEEFTEYINEKISKYDLNFLG